MAGPLVPDRYLPPLPVKAAGVIQPVQNAGKNRRHHQIRVGVRPRDAILHAVVLPLAARNTQRDGAVVMPPRSLRRDVHPRLEAAIRVHVRRQQRHRGRHQIDHPGQRAFEQRRVFPIAVHQHVFPLLFSMLMWICIPLPACSS